MSLQISTNAKATTEYNKCDLLIFPRIDFNHNTAEDQAIISYFERKHHRIFYCNIEINSTKGTEQDLFNTKQYLDRVIKENKIKDCVLIVEDLCWQQAIIFLKEKYNFKVILNYAQQTVSSIKLEGNLFQYDDKILEASNEIILYIPNINKETKIANKKVNILSNLCSPEYIEDVIKRIHGLMSIIIVTFNNLSYTQQCINSILTKTAYPNFEIIVVDNNSQDSTAEYLLQLEESYSNVKVMLNGENLGFAKANNMGIRHASGKYIILLNNDTIVTKGWITGFVKHLERDEKLALVGPVTNGAWTESKIPVSYSNIEDMDDFAGQYTTDNFNKLYTDLEMLEMFCVATTRKIIEKIGYLDENFGLGTFEDDDYSYRVKLNGYKIACAEDVFIHHFVSASFNKQKHEERMKTFYINKEIFERKWGTTWKPHELRK